MRSDKLSSFPFLGFSIASCLRKLESYHFSLSGDGALLFSDTFPPILPFHVVAGCFCGVLGVSASVV